MHEINNKNRREGKKVYCMRMLTITWYLCVQNACDNKYCTIMAGSAKRIYDHVGV